MKPPKYLKAKDLDLAPLFDIPQLGKQLGNSLIIAPHPDDESLGCGGIIQYLIQQHSEVWICFITSGEASHLNSKKYSSEKLAQTREEEAINACMILGIEKENILFFRQPDAKLSKLDEKKKKSIAKKISELVAQHEIVSILAPWRRDSHSDHRVAFDLASICKEFCGDNLQLIEYPIWIWKNSQPEDWPKYDEVNIYKFDIRDKLQKKKEAIFAHKSQTSHLIDDDPTGFILTEDLLTPFLSAYEYLFFDSEKNLKSLSKEYFDTLYSHNIDPWDFKGSEYEKSKYEKIDTYLNHIHFQNGLELGCSIGIHTSYLANHCSYILAVDISEKAIEEAKRLNSELENASFKVTDILQHFPAGPFDFISMCEIGYYFSQENLMHIFKEIVKNLRKGGYFLMVHWSSYVQEYPITGKKVRELFEDYINMSEFDKVNFYQHEKYELVLWKKNI